MVQKYKLIGISSPIHDGMGKASGHLKYAGDMHLPGMLYAKLVYSTVTHGRILEVDSQAAEALAGVVKVLTCFNSPQIKYNRSRVMASEETVNQEQLFPQQVRYIGDRIAMVVATSQQTAEEAAALIKARYEELPSVITIKQAMADSAPLLHEEGNVYQSNLEYGKPPQGQEGIYVKSDLSMGRLHHTTLETHCAVADYDDYSDKLTIWTPCQSVFAVRTGVADILGHPYHKVRVIKTVMGGSYGCKQETILEPLAALAAMSVKAPVRLIISREEAIVSTVARGAMAFSINSTFTPEGKFLSVDMDCILDAGAYLTNSLYYVYTMGAALNRIYNIPYINYRGKAVCTNTLIAGSYRSWGSTEIATAIEQHLDAAADKLGLDKIEIRKKNLLKPFATNKSFDISIGDCRTRKCLVKGSETFTWEKQKQECRIFNDNSPRYKQGIGVGIGAHINGFYPELKENAVLSLRFNEDGTVSTNICLHDHGCGTITVFKKIIAEVLGLKEEEININHADTEYNYYDYGCYGSRTTYIIGRAAKNCAEKLLAYTVEEASHILNTPVKNLATAAGKVYPKDKPQAALTFGRISQICQENNLELCAFENHSCHSNPTAASAHFAKVEVDIFTGRVKVLRYLAVHDIGKALNPAMCVAQIGGAAQQGIGAALSEDILIDEKSGLTKTQNLDKYHLINFPDMPPVETFFLEHEGDEGPFAAKSIGETAIVPVASAITSAVNDALGKPLHDLPLTPVKILTVSGGGDCHA